MPRNKQESNLHSDRACLHRKPWIKSVILLPTNRNLSISETNQVHIHSKSRTWVWRPKRWKFVESLPLLIFWEQTERWKVEYSKYFRDFSGWLLKTWFYLKNWRQVLRSWMNSKTWRPKVLDENRRMKWYWTDGYYKAKTYSKLCHFLGEGWTFCITDKTKLSRHGLKGLQKIPNFQELIFCFGWMFYIPCKKVDIQVEFDSGKPPLFLEPSGIHSNSCKCLSSNFKKRMRLHTQICELSRNQPFDWPFYKNTNPSYRLSSEENV